MLPLQLGLAVSLAINLILLMQTIISNANYYHTITLTAVKVLR